MDVTVPMPLAVDVTGSRTIRTYRVGYRGGGGGGLWGLKPPPPLQINDIHIH